MQPGTPLSQVCSVTDAAKLLGVSEERVLQFARAKRIAGTRFKREWVLDVASVKAFAKQERKSGRPKGAKQ